MHCTVSPIIHKKKKKPQVIEVVFLHIGAVAQNVWWVRNMGNGKRNVAHRAKKPISTRRRELD
jgi:hypothetical protein